MNVSGPQRDPSSNISSAAQPQAMPRIVLIALAMCWLSLVISICVIVKRFSALNDVSTPAVALLLHVDRFALLIRFGINLVCEGIHAWLLVKIYRRRNWARIVLLLLNIGGFALMVDFSFFRSLVLSPSAHAIAWTQISLGLVPLFLLFGRAANQWFHSAPNIPFVASAKNQTERQDDRPRMYDY